METDKDRVDAAVLALLYLTLDRDGRAWKGFDWSVMNRLHHKGMIRNPVGKAQSVFLAEEGIALIDEVEEGADHERHEERAPRNSIGDGSPASQA